MEKIRKLSIIGLVFCSLALLSSVTTQAAMMTFNSDTPGNNSTYRTNWLSTIGITTPQYLVNFESGFTNNQNISGVPGLFPVGLIITDTSSAGQAIIRSGAGVINGSNPVGIFSLTHNEQAYLVLDFSSNPVDYVAFQDIDQAGTQGAIVTFVGGSTANSSFETTGVSGDSAEFFGIYRNDMPRITKVQLDVTGDALWGIDTIEYGASTVPVPEPATMLLLGSGLVGLAGYGRKKFFKK